MYMRDRFHLTGKGAHLYPADWPPQPHLIHDFWLHVAVLLLQPNGETHPGQSQSCQSAVPVPPSISRTTPTERRGPQEMVLRPIEQLRQVPRGSPVAHLQGTVNETIGTFAQRSSKTRDSLVRKEF